MILHIFDETFTRRGVLDSYLEVNWTEDYYDRGEFTLACVDSAANIALLKQGWYVYRADKQTAMIIRYVKYISADSQIWVKGYTTTDLINQRVIHKTQTASNVEQSMYNLVSTNLTGNRAIPNFTVASRAGYPETFETQFTGVNLLEALNALGAESQLGFYTQFDWKNKRHVFTVYKGLDRTSGQRVNRPAPFSSDFRNLNNVTIIDDISLFRNVAYVAGGGEGEERYWVVVNDQDFSGRERFELAVDARDLQRTVYEDGNEITYSDQEYEAILTARGIKKLNEHIRTETFVAEIKPAGFGTDFYLGDVVSCKSDKYGVRIDTRILSYMEVSQGGFTTLSLTMGNPEITALEVVKTWMS